MERDKSDILGTTSQIIKESRSRDSRAMANLGAIDSNRYSRIDVNLLKHNVLGKLKAWLAAKTFGKPSMADQEIPLAKFGDVFDADPAQVAEYLRTLPGLSIEEGTYSLKVLDLEAALNNIELQEQKEGAAAARPAVVEALSELFSRNPGRGFNINDLLTNIKIRCGKNTVTNAVYALMSGGKVERYVGRSVNNQPVWLYRLK